MRRPTSRLDVMNLEDRLTPSTAFENSSVFGDTVSVALGSNNSGAMFAQTPPNLKLVSLTYSPLTDKFKIGYSSASYIEEYRVRTAITFKWCDQPTLYASTKIVNAGPTNELSYYVFPGTFQFEFNRSLFTDPSGDPDLKYLIAHIGNPYVTEIDYSDNEKSMLIPSVAAALTVTSKNDSNSDPNTFGDYLSGVSFSNLFTVKTGAADVYTKKIEMFVTGYPHTDNKPIVLPWVASGTSFNLDVGRLSVGNHTMQVRSLDAAERPLAEYTGIIKVVENTSLNVRVKPTVGTADYDIDQLRVLKGIPASFKATAVLDNLPNWNFYNKRMGLQFVDKSTNTKGPILGFTGLSGNTMTLTSPLSSTAWKDTVTNSGADDYDVFLVPLASYNLKNPDKQLSPADGLKVVSVPSWLAGQQVEFKSDVGTTNAFGNAEPGYRFNVKIEKSLSANVPVSVGSEYGLLNGLKSSVSLETNLVVYAKLTENTGDAEFSAEKIGVSAVLFNKPVYNKKLDPNIVTIDGTINPVTLDAPTVITVRTTNPVSLLSNPKPKLAFSFGEKYGKTPWKVEAPLFGNNFLGLTGYASISGQFTAEVSKLDFSGALNFHFPDGKLVPDRATSTFQFDVAASATASLTGAVGINASVVLLGGFNLFNAEGTGAVTLNLTGTLAAKYGANGLEIDKTKTTGNIDLDYNFTFDASDITTDKSDSDADKTNSTGNKDLLPWNLGI